MNEMLSIRDLKVAAEDKVILDGLDLTIRPGEIHVLMGTNGAGKSTLASAIMGDPRYTIENGSIAFEGEEISAESADKRSRRGIFLSFQTPQEIPGVTLENFLRTAKGAVTGTQPKVLSFQRELAKQMALLGMDESYGKRYLNVGFSGGEKKKTEILQLLILNPKLALLDETDSGLDVDAVKTVTKGIRAWHNEQNALLIITHNAKILEGLDVDQVHILNEHRIVRTGGPELIREITESGFGAVLKEEE